MNETYLFLKEKTKVNYVATIDGNKPSNRPFGDPVLFDNKIYILTNKQKNCYKQFISNNNVSIVAYDSNSDNWIRVNAKLIEDSNNTEAKKAIINEFDWAEEAGFTLVNPDFAALYLSDVDATIYDIEGNVLSNYTF